MLNAGESIEGKLEQGNKDTAAIIKVFLEKSETEISVIIQDTGKGLPAGNREKLTEPYVTNREKGTGLGLAIVKKIMEDHGGSLVLEDNLDQTGEIIGARVHLVFPING